MLTLIAPAHGLSPAQARAITQWVHDGGALWVQLDQTGPDLPARLLGDAWRVEQLGRTARTAFTIAGDGVNQAVEHDYPIDIVLARAPDAAVRLRIDGHAAAVEWQVGAGRVLVTTAAPRAWLEGDTANAALAAINRFVPSDSGAASRTATQAERRRIEPLTRHAAAQVGHRVPARGMVAGVLILFLMAVLAAGLLLHRRGRLEWVAPFAVGLAVVAGLVMAGFGFLILRRTPNALSASVYAQAPPAAMSQHATAVLIAYRQPGAARADTLTYHGPPPLLNDDLLGQSVRIIQLDRNHWALENTDLAPGEAHSLPVGGVTDRAAPATVIGTLTDRGVQLRWAAGQGPALDDAVLTTGLGRLGVTALADGVLEARFADRLTGNQYFNAAMLGQQQVERAAVYARLLADDAPAGIALMGWLRDDGDAAVRIEPLDPGVEPAAQTLAAFPVRFDRPAAGQAVRIPSLLLAMSPVTDRKRGLSTTAYDAKARTWITNMTNEQTAVMAFEIPPAFRGIDVDAVEVRVDLSAPGRDCAVVTYTDGEVREIHKARGGINGPLRLTDASFTPQLRRGQVLLGLRVGAAPLGQEVRGWTVSEVEIDIVGSAPPR